MLVVNNKVTGLSSYRFGIFYVFNKKVPRATAFVYFFPQVFIPRRSIVANV